MNKKEVLEIRKQFTPANCAITRIRGCYVNHDKEIISTSDKSFLMIEESEQFKYFNLFKKTLSGKLGRSLLDMDFPLEQERKGGTQAFLLELRDSALKDDELAEEFFSNIIEHYNHTGNYYITLIHGVYDIPGKSSDGMALEDASDYVYSYILCCISNVRMSKPVLGYDEDSNEIKERVRDWYVEDPAHGFLFPTFTDREPDIHSLLYYSNKQENIQKPFIEYVLGTKVPLTAAVQKACFNMVLEDTLGENLNCQLAKTIHENIRTVLEENKENQEPVRLDVANIRKLLEHSGVEIEKLETLEQQFEINVGKGEELIATNITGIDKLCIETNDVEIKVDADRMDLVEAKLVEGRQCIIIPVDDHVSVNDAKVKTL